ncbi:MAG: GNAT family N-acetyltransferase [Actinomycetota bacterium]
MPGDPDLLRRLDVYLDAVPRTAARTETIGPFTLFIQSGNGWRYYARPAPGAERFEPGDIDAVRARQRELGQPEAIEWIVDLAPSVGPAAAATGMVSHRMPLMHLPANSPQAVTIPDGVDVRIAGPDDDLATVSAVAAVGFGAPGTEVGEAGTASLPGAAAAMDAGILAFSRERVRAGLTVTAAAFVDGVPVSVGSHQPHEGATEIVGVATLPAFRRRGLGAAVTAALIEDAVGRGIGVICLSAGNVDIARVYERAGFVTVGHVGAAEPAGAGPASR